MGARAQHDEYPDGISHFGSTVIPALLAVAETHHVRGDRVLAAMIAGYEVGGRIASASVGDTSARGFRPTGLYGPFAAAASAGNALGLEPEMLVSALALAANSSAGLLETWLGGTDEWRYQTAFAGRNGFAAARLAAAGVRGSASMLDGPKGFNRAFAGVDVDSSFIASGLGSRWVMDDVLLKPYPICAFNQAPVQQLLELTAAHRIDPREIEAIRIHMNAEDLTYPGIDTIQPVETRAAALMCLRTCVAIASLDSDITIQRLECPGSPDVRNFSSRVELVADASVSSHTSFVEVSLSNAPVLCSGQPRRVVYDDAVAAALVDRLRPLIGLKQAQMQRLLDAVETLDQRDGVGRLLDAIRAN